MKVRDNKRVAGAYMPKAEYSDVPVYLQSNMDPLTLT